LTEFLGGVLRSALLGAGGGEYGAQKWKHSTGR